MNILETLRFSWESLLQPFQVNPKVAQKVFLDLVAAYSSAERFYHTLEHIQHILETTEQMHSVAINFPAIQLAAWFHDVIYAPRAKDNEENSAEYAVASLIQLEIPISTVERVKSLIINTKTHQAPAADIDSQILLDSDLAILGADELKYRAYAQAIRQEYSWLSDQLYQVGRKQVLQLFLQRERIYFTNLLFIRCEERARQNLQAELATLSSK